jgi:YidC/Oxa1 family membrane protein insertase
MIVVANVLQPLIDFAEAILKFWHDTVGFGWGASIIGLTVVIRLLILPLTFKQVRSMQELQRLQPEIKRLQARYKDDRQRQQQEMMKFYQEHKVNPLGSCLPLLLQLPFFLALFYLLRDEPLLRGESFLFIEDLAEKATGGVLVVLIVLYVVSQLAASAVTAVSADRNQRLIMFGLPFLFVLFIINFESGLIVYWITTNVWTFGQQMFVKKFMPKPEPIEPRKDEEPRPARGKPAPARSATDGKPAKGKAAPAASGEKGSNGADGGPKKAPPRSPRKKKKRTGRRR